MGLAESLSDVLEDLRGRIDGRVEIGRAPFRERIDLRSALKALVGIFVSSRLARDRDPSVVGRLRDRALIVTFQPAGLLSVDVFCAGPHRFTMRGDLSMRGRPPEDLLTREDVLPLLVGLQPMRSLVVGERLLEYDGDYDPESVTADEVFDRLDALERLATALSSAGPPEAPR